MSNLQVSRTDGSWGAAAGASSYRWQATWGESGQTAITSATWTGPNGAGQGGIDCSWRTEETEYRTEQRTASVTVWAADASGNEGPGSTDSYTYTITFQSLPRNMQCP